MSTSGTPPASALAMHEKYFAQSIPGRAKRLPPNEVVLLAAGMERHLKEQREQKCRDNA
ncbi:MAG TPA: hypothetical protein VGI81_14820 [Tepidisphaeraceae bacterium]|jgi:hypothetical protein